MKRPKKHRTPRTARKSVNVLHAHYDEVLKEPLPGKLKEATRLPGTAGHRDGRKTAAKRPTRGKHPSEK